MVGQWITVLPGHLFVILGGYFPPGCGTPVVNVWDDYPNGVLLGSGTPSWQSLDELEYAFPDITVSKPRRYYVELVWSRRDVQPVEVLK